MGDRDDVWRELERRGAVYARILFSVQEGQARVDAVVLYDGYAPPWHHELGEVEPRLRHRGGAVDCRRREGR